MQEIRNAHSTPPEAIFAKLLRFHPRQDYLYSSLGLMADESTVPQSKFKKIADLTLSQNFVIRFGATRQINEKMFANCY